MAYPERFEKLYESLGVADSLHCECPHARECWVDEHRPRMNEAYDRSQPTFLPRPWIGPRYGDLRLLCVAINMNDWGGRTACEELVLAARREMAAGAVRVR